MAPAPKTRSNGRIKPDESQVEDGDVEMEPSSDGLDMRKFLEDFQKRQARKAEIHSSAFDANKKAIYADTRKQAKLLSRNGIDQIEQFRENLQLLRKSSLSYDDYLKDLVPIWKAQEATMQTLIHAHEPYAKKLYPALDACIEEGEAMLQTNPIRRGEGLKSFLVEAHAEVERTMQEQMIATDASKLIKHYKALLLS